MIYQTDSAEETKSLAYNLAKKYKNGAILALSGELGAGKTVFAQGLAAGLGITNQLISPTFILIRQYPLPHNPTKYLFHIDLYRLDNPSQINSLGLEEIWADPANIILIEWAEKLGPLLPKKAVVIKIEKINQDSRRITVDADAL